MPDRETDKLISPAAADALIAAHDGDVALYCLYAARHPEADAETAAAVLCRTRAEIDAAREKLQRLLKSAPGRRAEPEQLVPAEESVQYPVRDIVDSFRNDSGFSPLVDELGRIIGTVPSRAYLNALVDMYDHLGMPPEVIMLLLHYCDGESRRRWGSSRRPTPRYLTEEAYRWANREILTLELAEDYIREMARRREDKVRLAELLGIRGRELSQTESKYVETWAEMGFDDEAILMALDKTLTNTGALKWRYMNGILEKWHAKGLHSVAAIEEAEGKHRPGSGGRSAQQDEDDEDLAGRMKQYWGERA